MPWPTMDCRTDNLLAETIRPVVVQDYVLTGFLCPIVFARGVCSPKVRSKNVPDLYV